MEQMYPHLWPGATTVGIVCKDGVILGSEKRVSYGYYIMSKSGKKVFKITDKIGAACAGFVSDFQISINEAKAYSRLFELDTGRPIPVKSVAKLVSNMLFRSRLFPLITQTIIGGIDETGPGIYILDLLGSVVSDKFACVGSGASIAIGVLEANYKDDITADKGRDLVIQAIKSAISRDAMSGNGIDLLIITKEGIKEETIPFE